MTSDYSHETWVYRCSYEEALKPRPVHLRKPAQLIEIAHWEGWKHLSATAERGRVLWINHEGEWYR
ncbi:hypothetical protein [Candidatus Poriferisocius sp.]|uniref:hypothetical protein n=1 Tax=Candidatus Poriferisocius sp. TaxID=3101276 RepID=UPI003B5158F8